MAYIGTSGAQPGYWLVPDKMRFRWLGFSASEIPNRIVRRAPPKFDSIDKIMTLRRAERQIAEVAEEAAATSAAVSCSFPEGEGCLSDAPPPADLGAAGGVRKRKRRAKTRASAERS